MKKKYKKGFFLSETIVVLAIVAVILISVFKIFSSTYTKFKESENYNTINSIIALSSIKKYYESFGELDDIFKNADFSSKAFTDLTSYDNIHYYINEINKVYYESIESEYNVNNIYLIDMAKIKEKQFLDGLNISFRNYIKSLKDSNEKFFIINVSDNQYASISIKSLKPSLVGESDDEFGVYINIGDENCNEFVNCDPGYLNWNKAEPIKTWENDIEYNKDIPGTYYLHYNFDGYEIKRKIVVMQLNFNFDYLGEGETFVAPYSGYYQIELWGASGGGDTGGKGAYTKGTIYIKKNQPLYIFVGGQGNTNGKGGYNGGGNAGVFAINNDGGGGATDIRFGGIKLNDRIIVAAGGGGANANGTNTLGIGFTGGAGGGLTGIAGTSKIPNMYGLGGTQTTGGNAGNTSVSGTTPRNPGESGFFGRGGNGTNDIGTNETFGGAGGGGGYYGGGSGEACYQNCGASGGGGSSYISGHTGCVSVISSENTASRTGTQNSTCTTGTTDNLCSIHYSKQTFTDTLMIDGDDFTWTNIKNNTQGINLMPNPNGENYTSGVGHTGNGYVKITFKRF